MSLLIVNQIIMLINIAFGIWFVVTAISQIFSLPSERDLRPLVLPIFVTLGYVILQLVYLMVYMKNPEEVAISTLDIVWRLIESGFILSLNLVVQALTKHRDCRVKEKEHDGLIAH